MLYSKAENESRLTARRGSQPKSDREKIALDITALKKQYDKLRERQKQAQVILSSAVSKQQQKEQQQQTQPGPSNMNKLLMGKNAIVSKSRRGPPKGAIPPARNQKNIKQKPTQNATKPDETIHWKNIEEAKRRNSMTWKEINSERRQDELKKSSSASSLGTFSLDTASPKRRSDSSSYSEESDNDSSPSTSLCDEDGSSSRTKVSPKMKKKKKRTKDLQIDVTLPTLNIIEETSPLTSTSADDANNRKLSKDCFDGGSKSVSPNTSRFYLDLPTNFTENQLTSTSQLSPLPDLSNYFTAISPIKTPCGFFVLPEFNNFLLTSNDDDKFQVSEDGVTNEFFERCYEDNLTSSMIDKSPPDILLSSSPLPSNDNNQNEDRTMKATLYKKHKSLSMDEKTMSEQNCDERILPTAINRSYSDGIVLENIDDFQKIIADNRRMLNKLNSRSDDIRLAMVDESKVSPTNLSDVEEEEIAAIDRSDENEKDVDEEMCSDIQDIGNIQVLLRSTREERREREEEMSSSVACIKTNAGDEGKSSSSSNVTTVAQAESTSRDTRENDEYENVKCFSETSEKSMMMTTMSRNENEASAQATPILSSLENHFAAVEEKKIAEEGEHEEYCGAAKSEHCNPSPIAKAREDEVVTRDLESPKFNEIQLMVQKLKEEMENEMKNVEEVRKNESGGEEGAKKEPKEKLVDELKEKIEEKQQKSTTTNGNNNENSSSRSQSRESEVMEKIENGKLRNCELDKIEKITKKTTGKVVQIAIIVESEDDGHVMEIENSPVEIIEKKIENCGAKSCEKSNEKKIDEKNEKKTTPPNGDLEKLPSKAQQKIDNSSDDSSSVMTTTTTTVTTVKTTCENCQRRQKEESETSLDDCQQKKSSASKTLVEGNEVSATSQPVKISPKQQHAVVAAEKEPEETIPPTPEVEVKKVVETSSKPTPSIVKKHQQSESEKAAAASRRRDSSSEKKKSREVVRYDVDESSKIVIKEKYLTNEEKSAVMELAELIKERELEKLSELKREQEEIKREQSVSPARSAKSKSNRSSPTESILSSSSRHLYDHEPRSDFRRRDLYTKEHEHKSRRTRKSVSPLGSPLSSPTGNLRDTLSSIQNTIKYLDHCCRDAKKDGSKTRKHQTPPRKYDPRVYENIEKVCENDYTWMQSVSRYSPPPFEKEISPIRMSSSSYDDDFYREKREPRHPIRYHRPLDDETRYEVVVPRYPERRRYDRSLSPVRTRYYDYDDSMTLSSSSYRSRRDVSSSSLSPPRYKARTPPVDEDPTFIFKIHGLTTEQYLAAKRAAVTSSRDRLNYSSVSHPSYGDPREPYSYSKSPLGSRERMNFSSSGGHYSSLGGSRDRLNIAGTTRSALSDSREFLYSKSPLGASRERLNMSTMSTLSKSPFTSTERLYSSKSNTNDDFDRYYPNKRALSGSSDRINSSNLKSALSTSRERLDTANKLSQSYLTSSREKLDVSTMPFSDHIRSKSPAIIDNYDKFYPIKPLISDARDKLDAKYGFSRSPTNPSISTTTTTTHVSRAPTKSPVTVQSSTSYLKPSEERPTSSKMEVSPSKFVRFDMNCKSRSPIDYDSTITDQSSVTNSYNDSPSFRPNPTAGNRKFDY